MLWDWLGANWINILETLTLIVGVLSIRENTKARHLSNLISLTKNHRELSTFQMENPKLERALVANRDLMKEPVSAEEREFINLKILHFKASFEALKDGMAVDNEGVVKDVKEVFSLPTVAAVWKEASPYYELAFASFIEECLSK
jgi:hypothetical protein